MTEMNENLEKIRVGRSTGSTGISLKHPTSWGGEYTPLTQKDSETLKGKAYVKGCVILMLLCYDFFVESCLFASVSPRICAGTRIFISCGLVSFLKLVEVR